jgi:hypothetical protein
MYRENFETITDGNLYDNLAGFVGKVVFVSLKFVDIVSEEFFFSKDIIVNTELGLKLLASDLNDWVTQSEEYYRSGNSDPWNFDTELNPYNVIKNSYEKISMNDGVTKEIKIQIIENPDDLPDTTGWSFISEDIEDYFNKNGDKDADGDEVLKAADEIAKVFGDTPRKVETPK